MHPRRQLDHDFDGFPYSMGRINCYDASFKRVGEDTPRGVPLCASPCLRRVIALRDATQLYLRFLSRAFRRPDAVQANGVATRATKRSILEHVAPLVGLPQCSPSPLPYSGVGRDRYCSRRLVRVPGCVSGSMCEGQRTQV